MREFSEIYDRLNAKQKEAVDTLYGPVLVIAGPGSGKTQILAARIANILRETDYLPSNILCLTFTESAALNMRNRLAQMIGPHAYQVAIHTFHSFGNEILNRYRFLSREYSEAKAIDDLTASKFLDSILADLPWNDPYKPGMRASDTIKEIRASIDNLKKGGVTPESFRAIITENQKTLTRLAPILAEYFTQMDGLSQKREDKEKKQILFSEFTEKVRELCISVENGGIYESLTQTILRGLETALDSSDGSSKTTYITKWRDAWTMKGVDGNRVWKEQEKIAKQYSLLSIYEKYQSRLKSEGYIDFSDMLLEATDLIEHHSRVRLDLAEQYQCILIDEYQDTNEAQMGLILSILSGEESRESPNIFAVGDDDQSIYKFQGANTKNIRDFSLRWSDTRLIILDTNYRSFAPIITESRSVIDEESHNIGQIFPGAQKDFCSARGEEGIVMKTTFDTEASEVAWIISDIEAKIASGVPPHEIAIITKKNKTLELFAKELLARQIPVSMSKTESLFESESIRLIVQILQYISSLVRDPQKERADILLQILAHPAFGVRRLTLWEISKSVAQGRKESTRSWIETLREHPDPSLVRLSGFFLELSRLSLTLRLEDLLDRITGVTRLPDLDEEVVDLSDRGTSQLLLFSSEEQASPESREYTSPLYEYFFAPLSTHRGQSRDQVIAFARHLTHIHTFIGQIRSFKQDHPFLTLADGIEFLTLIEYYQIPLGTTQMIGNDTTSVNLITVHKAKGLEWAHVYTPCLSTREYQLTRNSASVLPKNLPLEPEKDDDGDISRLVYTAYTRARDTLTITHSSLSMDGRPNTPLPCIHPETDDWEEGSSLLRSLGETEDIARIAQVITRDHQDLLSAPYLGEERDFLLDRIEKRFVMNVTALQNFLDVSSGGPVHFIETNLLRFPQAKSIAASYGSAIHKALETFMTDYREKGTFMKSLLYDTFSDSLRKEGFDPATESDWLARGRENLDSLSAELMGRSYGELFLEKDFRTEGGGIYLDEIRLTGKIDCIEKRADGSLLITDYKTGGGFDQFDYRGGEYQKIKQWKYRLQLAFYALLFELSPRWRMYHDRRYELFFVEEDPREHRFHRVVDVIHQEEITRLKRLIRVVSHRISTLDFPDTSQYPPTLEGIKQFEQDILDGGEEGDGKKEK